MGSHVTNLTNHSTFTSQLGSVHILRHLPRGGGGFQKMTLDDGGEGGGGVYGQMTSSKIAQFRDFLYLKKLLAVSVYCDNVEI